MQNICSGCNTENRTEAKYCKRCGVKLPWLNGNHSPIDKLVGLVEVKAKLHEIESVIQAMKIDGVTIPMNYNTIVMGNSGVAKTLIGNIFYEMLKDNGIVKENKLHYIDAANLKAEEVQKAKDGMLMVDNCHLLINGDKGSDQFNKLLGEMTKSPYNPIVFLSGLSYGLKEFLHKPENKHIIGRFNNIFQVNDYNHIQLKEIIEQKLKTYGFTVAPEASARLLHRCQYLLKMMKSNQGNIDMNGHLAEKERQGIQEQYFKQRGTNKTIQECHILGEVHISKSMDEIMRQLDSFIGMDGIKKSIKSLAQQLSVRKERARQGLAMDSVIPLHIVITGNPGTGKTTVIRVLGEVLEAIGIIDHGTVLEVDESKVIAQYIGQTAPNVNRLCDQAMGGILFIDEAYSLVKDKSAGANFGKEAIDTLMKRMEDDRGKFVVIVAGYQQLMEDFLTSNPGLKSRFTNYFHIEDYTEAELLEIFKMFVQKEHFTITTNAIEKLKKVIKQVVLSKTNDFANGRTIRNLFEKAVSCQSQRVNNSLSAVTAVSMDFLQEITEEDIPFNQEENDSSKEVALQKLKSLIGLQSIKVQIDKIINELEIQKIRNQQKLLVKHFIFSGNPGTGKTTVARILADIFKAINLLPTNNLIEVSRAHLVASYVGQTAKEVNKVCDRAMGGVLFIDEAYTLCQGDLDSFGKEAINALLMRMENDRGKFIVIAAGYTKEMFDFLDTNPGLKSRFTVNIEFEDYNEFELTDIFKHYADQEKFQLADGIIERLQKGFEKLVLQKDKTFGNAREVRKIFDITCSKLSDRITLLQKNGNELKQLQLEADIIQLSDLPFEADEKIVPVEHSLHKLDGFIGLQNVKDKVKAIALNLKAQKLRGSQALITNHFVFTGNPGTGKTSVARVLGDIFKAIGLLPTNNVVEVKRADLVAAYVGHTAINVNKVCDRAIGGILFIDEVYDLVHGNDDQFGMEAINTLLTRMENDRGKIVVVVAGYSYEMNTFLNSNSGLKSRFTDTIEFEDYTAPELKEIFLSFAANEGFMVDEAISEELIGIFTFMLKNKTKNFGNARDARKLFDKVKESIGLRISVMENETNDTDLLKEAANRILKEDVLSAKLKLNINND